VVRQELEVTYPRPRFLRLFAAPWDSEKGGLALILQDATESRQETFEAIETERIQALTLLAASIAHEVGNPLNALHIHLQLLERELRRLRALKSELAVETRPGRRREKAAFQRAGEEEFEEVTGRLEKYLGVAKGEVGRLDYIVTQFLQALRPSPPQLRPASLNQTVEETVELLRPELENRRLAVELKLARHLPEAELDPPRIKQALVNLIKNSMHAMTPGGLLTLETGATAESVRVSVSDTGGGISQERLSRIFEPFYTTKKRGTGLGLMIVQRIVRDHGGRIEVESHLGKGTTFRLWFPLRERRPRLLEASTGAGAKECA
jgi:signal transduction histidine kinase